MPEQVGFAVSQVAIAPNHVEDLAQQHLPLGELVDFPEQLIKNGGRQQVIPAASGKVFYIGAKVIKYLEEILTRNAKLCKCGVLDKAVQLGVIQATIRQHGEGNETCLGARTVGGVRPQRLAGNGVRGEHFTRLNCQHFQFSSGGYTKIAIIGRRWLAQQLTVIGAQRGIVGSGIGQDHRQVFAVCPVIDHFWFGSAEGSAIF
jgi:hypothetical protein